MPCHRCVSLLPTCISALEGLNGRGVGGRRAILYQLLCFRSSLYVSTMRRHFVFQLCCNHSWRWTSQGSGSDAIVPFVEFDTCLLCRDPACMLFFGKPFAPHCQYTTLFRIPFLTPLPASHPLRSSLTMRAGKPQSAYHGSMTTTPLL